MDTARGLHAVETDQPSGKPSAELVPFLDALAELIAIQIIRELQTLAEHRSSPMVFDDSLPDKKTVEVQAANSSSEGQS